MYCSQCNSPLETDAKFCTNCGAKVTDVQTKSTASKTEATNDYVVQGKTIAKQYWNFLPNALAHPFTTSKQVTERDKINAIITIVLFSLLLPLYIYSSARVVMHGFMSPSFADIVIKPFFILIIFFALLIAVKFGVAKLMKADVSFMYVVTSFGSLMVLPTAIALATWVFALIGSITFSSILMLLAISLTSIASMATVFSLKTKAPATSKLDAVYGVVITYVAMGIILFIIGDSLLGNLLSEFQNNFYAPF